MPYNTKEKLYASQQAHRDRNHAKLWELLSESECRDCGLQDPRVFDFDHLPEFEKCFDIGRAVGGSTRSWASIKAEIDKCEVVCANCHRIRTMERGNFKRQVSHLASVSALASNELKP